MTIFILLDCNLVQVSMKVDIRMQNLEVLIITHVPSFQLLPDKQVCVPSQEVEAERKNLDGTSHTQNSLSRLQSQSKAVLYPENRF